MTRRAADVPDADGAVLDLPEWVRSFDPELRGGSRARWGFVHETWVVEAADGRRVVVQRRAPGENPTGPAARAMREVVREVVRAAGLVVPEPIRVPGRGRRRIVVTMPFIEGTPAADLLSTRKGADVAGRACGEVAARLASGNGRPGAAPVGWISPPRLPARSDLPALLPDQPPGVHSRLDRLAERNADDIGTAGLRLAHGDLAPVNVIVRAGRPVAVLDLDRARMAHPLYDAAWFGWIVAFHHPDAAETAWRAYVRAQGLPGMSLDFVSWMWPLLLLERLAESSQADERARWTRRLLESLSPGTVGHARRR